MKVRPELKLTKIVVSGREHGLFGIGLQREFRNWTLAFAYQCPLLGGCKDPLAELVKSSQIYWRGPNINMSVSQAKLPDPRRSCGRLRERGGVDVGYGIRAIAGAYLRSYVVARGKYRLWRNANGAFPIRTHSRKCRALAPRLSSWRPVSCAL
jgi:hypothetical protein